MNFKLNSSKDFTQVLELVGQDVELNYFVVFENGAKAIRRMSGQINGYLFSTETYLGKAHWQKRGRGKMKNEELVLETLAQADRYMVEQGYYFW